MPQAPHKAHRRQTWPIYTAPPRSLWMNRPAIAIIICMIFKRRVGELVIKNDGIVRSLCIEYVMAMNWNKRYMRLDMQVVRQIRNILIKQRKYVAEADVYFS